MAMLAFLMDENVCPSGSWIENRTTLGAGTDFRNVLNSVPMSARVSRNASTNKLVLDREGAEIDAMPEPFAVPTKIGSLNTNFTNDISATRFARSFARHRWIRIRTPGGTSCGNMLQSGS